MAETNQTPVGQARCRAHVLEHGPVVSRFHTLKCLEDSRDDVRHLRQGELLPDARAWTAAEGEILPPDVSKGHHAHNGQSAEDGVGR